MNAGVCGQAITLSSTTTVTFVLSKGFLLTEADQGCSDGLYFPCLVVCYHKSPQEAARVTTKMNSHCSQRTAVRRLTIVSRGFGGSNFRRPHQGNDRGFRLTAVAGIPRVLASWKARVPRESLQNSTAALFGSHWYNQQAGRVCH
jgi:hypothetical protein